MKVLVFASPDGDIDLINKTIKKESVDICICLGDLCLASESTPLEYFLRKKFRNQGERVRLANINNEKFEKPVYSIYGSLDDLFIPNNELNISGLIPVWSGIYNILATNDDLTQSKIIKLGFMSGYYNPKKFQKVNSSRKKMSRERKSLALSLEDYKNMRNNFDILFSYESPVNIPKPGFGCPRMYDLFMKSNSKIMFHGHHRSFGHSSFCENKHIFSVGELKSGYYIFDLFNGNIKAILNNNENIKEVIYAF